MVGSIAMKVALSVARLSPGAGNEHRRLVWGLVSILKDAASFDIEALGWAASRCDVRPVAVM